MKRLIVVVFAVLVGGCDIPSVDDIPPIPTGSLCSADGWVVNPYTGEIMSDDGTGAAIECEFIYE